MVSETITTKPHENTGILKVNAQEMHYVLAVYKGIVRAVFKPVEWYISDLKAFKRDRWEFTGTEVENSPYLNINVKKYIKPGNQNPIFYINM